MAKTIEDMFAEARGGPIHWNGQVVHGVFRFPVPFDQNLRIRFIQAKTERRQGLIVSIEKGTFEISGTRAKNFIFWADSEPAPFELINHSRQPGGQICVYNAWKNSSGGTDSFLMNAGILIDQQDATFILRCSDGIGEPSFDDVVIELSTVPNASRKEGE